MIRTITETIQGPNEGNQFCLLDTNRFFTPINNLLDCANVSELVKYANDNAKRVLKMIDIIVNNFILF